MFFFKKNNYKHLSVDYSLYNYSIILVLQALSNYSRLLKSNEYILNKSIRFDILNNNWTSQWIWIELQRK